MWRDFHDEDLDQNQKGPAALVRRTTSVWWVRVRNAAGAEGRIVYAYLKMATGGYIDETERCVR